MTRRKRVLLLSTTTGYQLRSFGESAAKLGVELMFATDRCHALDDPWQDAAVPVRFYDVDDSLRAILRAAQRRPVDGVIPVGDRPVVLAARVATLLGLPGNSPDAAAASANKRITRERFAAGGLPVPWYFGVRTTTDPRAVALKASFPLVVKPLGLSGSRGVIRANTPDELASALQRVYALLARRDVRALRTGLEDDILVEGFIEGKEYAIEGVMTAGDFHAFAIFDKPDPLDGPFFEETIYVTPASLPAHTERDAVVAVGRAARALGLRHGPVHAECRVGPQGVFVLEIAARPMGGLCSRVLRFGSEGAPPLEEILLRHALGEDVTGCRREDRAAGVMMIPIPGRGVLKQVEGSNRARAVPGVEDVLITAKLDQVLEPLPEAAGYLGFIFARGEHAAAVDAALREAHSLLRFVIDDRIGVRSA
ncbi:MAG: ATP-grasp domain-containing protein [Acidobacteria bacterium]|nr:ATP-grasp domain-containing protein [Acidobacteriota bacterium]